MTSSEMAARSLLAVLAEFSPLEETFPEVEDSVAGAGDETPSTAEPVLGSAFGRARGRSPSP